MLLLVPKTQPTEVIQTTRGMCCDLSRRFNMSKTQERASTLLVLLRETEIHISTQPKTKLISLNMWGNIVLFMVLEVVCNVGKGYFKRKTLNLEQL